MTTIETTLGELISVFYEEFLEQYGDEELASLAAASIVNDMLASASEQRAGAEKAA